MLLSKPKIFFLIIVAQFLSIASTCWAQQTAGTKPSEKPNGMITGRVVNSAGEFLVGAVVYATLLGTSSRSQRATVDTNGEFKIRWPGGWSLSCLGQQSWLCSGAATRSHRLAKLLSHRRFRNPKIDQRRRHNWHGNWSKGAFGSCRRVRDSRAR